MPSPQASDVNSPQDQERVVEVEAPAPVNAGDSYRLFGRVLQRGSVTPAMLEVERCQNVHDQ